MGRVVFDTSTLVSAALRVGSVPHGALAPLPGRPPRHNTCRLHRTKNPGAAMKDRSWHDTDKHSRTGRLLGCCRLKARRWSW